MLDVQTLLTTLASSTNRSYARWKALLSYHPGQMALILEQLDESTLDSIYDIKVIRLIERRAKSCRKASNRAYLLEWCKTHELNSKIKMITNYYWHYQYLLELHNSYLFSLCLFLLPVLRELQLN